MPTESWTIEQIELLKKLWAAGETAVAIGRRLGGVSRSAVLGKVFRLRLRAAAAAGRPKMKSVGANGLELNAAPVRRRRGTRDRPALPAAPITPHKSLFELTNATCRWPHGQPGAKNFFFCGLPEADLEQGIPYCARHMQRAYGGAPPAADAAGTTASDLRRWGFALRKFGLRSAPSHSLGRLPARHGR